MFTGIIESLGEIKAVRSEKSNQVFRIACTLDGQIKIDQSIAHDGVCLTVTDIFENQESGYKEYSLTAINETLSRTSLKDWKEGGMVNVERCLKADSRLDGHFVQGHVDDTGKIRSIKDENGSWVFTISFDKSRAALLVEKGSVCINGVSLTVASAGLDEFTVAIIPYTFEHTTFQHLKEGDIVNLEFDILGKYLQRHLELKA